MDFQDKASVVAMAKLCGVTLSDDEILSRYDQYRKDFIEQSHTAEPAKVEVFKRPF